MKASPLQPAEPRHSAYNIDPEQIRMRAANLAGMTSVKISDLFQDVPQPMSAESSIEIRHAVRELTLKALEKVDLCKIRSNCFMYSSVSLNLRPTPALR